MYAIFTLSSVCTIKTYRNLLIMYTFILFFFIAFLEPALPSSLDPTLPSHLALPSSLGPALPSLNLNQYNTYYKYTRAHILYIYLGSIPDGLKKGGMV